MTQITTKQAEATTRNDAVTNLENRQLSIIAPLEELLVKTQGGDQLTFPAREFIEDALNDFSRTVGYDGVLASDNVGDALDEIVTLINNNPSLSTSLFFVTDEGSLASALSAVTTTQKVIMLLTEQITITTEAKIFTVTGDSSIYGSKKLELIKDGSVVSTAFSFNAGVTYNVNWYITELEITGYTDLQLNFVNQFVRRISADPITNLNLLNGSLFTYELDEGGSIDAAFTQGFWDNTGSGVGADGFFFVNNLADFKLALADTVVFNKSIYVAGGASAGPPWDLGSGDTWNVYGWCKVYGAELFFNATNPCTLSLAGAPGGSIDFYLSNIGFSCDTIDVSGTASTRFRRIDAPAATVIGSGLAFEVGRFTDSGSSQQAFWDNTAPDIAEHTALISGVLTGCEVEINAGDNTLFDVNSGTGFIEDWSDPSMPVGRKVTFDGVIGEAVPNLLGVFTVLAIRLKSPLVPDGQGGFEGEIFAQSGALFNNTEMKTQITIQLLSHTSTTQLDFVDGSSIPAYGVTDNVLEYIRVLGPINNGNGYTSNGTTDGAQKALGSTTNPFLNRMVNPFDPVTKTDIAQANAVFVASYRDGVGGFTFQLPTTVIDTDLWDDGSGTLVALTNNNKWSIKRITFFSQTQQQGISYGQAEYNSADEATDALFTENPSLTPLNASGSFTTALICKKGADLSDPAEALFFLITDQVASTGITPTPVSLQIAYSNGPLIATSVANGEIIFQRGTAADTDNVLVVQNGAGTDVVQITGEGEGTWNGLQTFDDAIEATSGANVSGFQFSVEGSFYTNTYNPDDFGAGNAMRHGRDGENYQLYGDNAEMRHRRESDNSDRHIFEIDSGDIDIMGVYKVNGVPISTGGVTPDSWTTPTPITNTETASGFTALRYRKDGIDGVQVEGGWKYSTGFFLGAGNTVTLFTLPVGSRPTNAYNFQVTCVYTSTAVTNLSDVWCRVNTDGVVEMRNNDTTIDTNFVFMLNFRFTI